METGTLVKKIAKLPENLKGNVEAFVDALTDLQSKDKTYHRETNKYPPRPVFGSGKGIFGKMADDFDEPLDDLKEYM